MFLSDLESWVKAQEDQNMEQSVFTNSKTFQISYNNGVFSIKILHH